MLYTSITFAPFLELDILKYSLILNILMFFYKVNYIH